MNVTIERTGIAIRAKGRWRIHRMTWKDLANRFGDLRKDLRA